MTKAERLGRLVEDAVTAAYWTDGKLDDFWEFEAHRIYSALHDLVSFAAEIEKDALK